MDRTHFPTKNYPAQIINSAKIEKKKKKALCCLEMEVDFWK